MGIFTDWLHDAIEIGNHCGARICIKLGADIDQADKFGSPPLWHAILKNDYTLVTLLFKHKANPNNYYIYNDDIKRTLIQGCVYSLDRSLIQLFILQGAKTDNLTYSSGITYSPEIREMKEVVTQAEQYYQELLCLQNELAEGQNNLWVYRGLKVFWEKLAATETNKAIQLCYVEQAQQAIQAIKTIEKHKKSLPVSSRLSLTISEKAPLLAATMEDKQIPTTAQTASVPHLKSA